MHAPLCPCFARCAGAKSAEQILGEDSVEVAPLYDQLAMISFFHDRHGGRRGPGGFGRGFRICIVLKFCPQVLLGIRRWTRARRDLICHFRSCGQAGGGRGAGSAAVLVRSTACPTCMNPLHHSIPLLRSP